MTVSGNRTVVKGAGEASAQGPGAFANTGVINHLHLASRQAPTSGYLLQVEALAAADFRGREKELAELSSFCTDDSPGEECRYWRWLAPAWAGKSALLAKFVLDPPPGVDVVSFFITSRLARQNDAAAFCEVVQRQLSSLLQEEEPLTTPYTREEQLLLAMARAARLCAERGRRLVLVVDGLDEDRGVIAGPDCHSIAALLPRVLPQGMRVIVAGRPHPPVPGDVPAGHPLRTTGINHWLQPSPHAQAARWDAEQDLLRLLDGGGLGRELVGLTVAAGGGLSAHDLAELSRSRPRLVELELSAVSGRSFQQRSPHWAPASPAVYLLAHEEIQRSAVQLLTDDEVSGYRILLHRWADRYREAGWPATTPEYLLRGYTQMLRELGETQRLVVLARDAARHERLWQVTGADLAGLSEVSASLEQLRWEGGRSDQDVDVSMVVRLAAARDRLHDQMSHLPAELIALWARLGHTARAVSLAKAQGDSFHRVEALRAIAGSLAGSGHLDQAWRLAESADCSDDRDRFGEAIAKGLAKAGQHAEAMRVAYGIEGAEPRAKAFVAATMAWATALAQPAAADPRAYAGIASDVNEAVAAVDRVSNTVTQAPLYAMLATALSQLGHDERARELAERGANLESRDGPARRAQLLAYVAQQTAMAPRLVSQAAAFATASVELAVAIDDPDDVPWLFPHVAAALEAIGQHEEAIDVIHRGLTDQDDVDSAMSSTAAAAVRAGDIGRALDLAGQISDPFFQAVALNAIGTKLAGSGDTDRAARAAERSLEVIDAVTDIPGQVKLLASTASFLQQAGHEEQAHEVAVTATNIGRYKAVPRHMVKTFIEVATALGRSGHAEEGFRLVCRARAAAEAEPDCFARLTDLAEVAVGLHGVGRNEAADELLSLAAAEARNDLHRSQRTNALQRVAEAYGRTGSPSKARELALEIIDLQHTTDSPSLQSWDRDFAAHAFLAAGDLDRATELIDSLPEDAACELLSSVVARLLTIGDLEGALKIAEEIEDTNAGQRSLGLVAERTAAAGDIDGAFALLDRISREASLPSIVKGMAEGGALDQARALAGSLTAPEYRSKALGAIAQSLGPTTQGRSVLVDALSLGPWIQLIEEIAHVAPEQLLLLCEVALHDS
jgi:hypothetical protein